jgi:inorganic pyrophosphatase
MSTSFWQHLDQLVATSNLKIDRPKGSAHPRYPDLIYPHDYGYLENTQSGDGDGIDVWLGSLPEKIVTALICTVDMGKRDAEVKILLGCTPQEAREILETHNSGPSQEFCWNVRMPKPRRTQNDIPQEIRSRLGAIRHLTYPRQGDTSNVAVLESTQGKCAIMRSRIEKGLTAAASPHPSHQKTGEGIYPRKPCSGSGLLAKISSICFITTGVSLSITSSAFIFSTTCSGLDAPVITVLTHGFFKHQARAN